MSDPSPDRPHRPADPRPLRVAVTLTQCWHRVPGGTATSVLDLVRALGAGPSGLDLVGVGPRSGRLPAAPWTPPIEVVRLGLPLPYLYDAWTLLGRPTVESATGPVDLVHLTVPITPPRTEVPLVATVHDVLPLTRPEWFTGRGARLMRRGLDAIRRTAAVVMVPSQVVADEAAAQGFDPGRLVVVPWGAGPAPAPGPDDTATRRRHGLTGPYVLFVGTAEPRKGLAVLAAALVRLGRPDLTLALAGPPGWGDADGGLLASVPGPVVRLGFVDRSDLPSLQRGAELAVVPSLAEGFGLPVLEALSAGAAVVTTSGTACGEVAGPAAELVPPADPQSLADAMARLLDDAPARDRLRRAGPARAAGFRWADTAQAVRDVYERVGRGRTGGRS